LYSPPPPQIADKGGFLQLEVSPIPFVAAVDLEVKYISGNVRVKLLLFFSGKIYRSVLPSRLWGFLPNAAGLPLLRENPFFGDTLAMLSKLWAFFDLVFFIKSASGGTPPIDIPPFSAKLLSPHAEWVPG